MKRQHKPKMTRHWWIVLAAGISACAPVAYDGGGAFCDVYTSRVQFPREVAALVVSDARAEAVKIDSHNRYFDENCKP